MALTERHWDLEGGIMKLCISIGISGVGCLDGLYAFQCIGLGWVGLNRFYILFAWHVPCILCASAFTNFSVPE